jgi:hypothetical protein
MRLFDYPIQSYVGRIVPKARIYAHAKVSARLKSLFVQQVDQITWKYKLAPETINIPAVKVVPEIQIFAVALRTGEIHLDILRSIDKAIPFPIVYEISYEDRVKVMACYKRQNGPNSQKWVVRNYFGTDWMSVNSSRQSLPVKLDLADLYDELLGALLPYPSRDNESLQQHIERLDAITLKQKELSMAEAALEKEKQFNRKVELNSKIRNMKEQIDMLKASSGNKYGKAKNAHG